jgi:seryl-tRNA synthetase
VENAEAISQNILSRQSSLPEDTVPRVVALHARFTSLTTEYNAKRNAQTQVSDRLKAAPDEATRSSLLEEVRAFKAELKALQRQLDEVEDELLRLAVLLPNETHPDVPDKEELLATYGPQPISSDTARDHLAIADALDLIDCEGGVHATGASFYVLRNEAALLELALVSYATTVATRHGFTFCTTPDIVRRDVMLRCGFQHRDAATQTYELVPPPHRAVPVHVLAGTAEIPLAAMHARAVIAEKHLPKLYAGLGRAFRAEAGAKGGEARGLYRTHQFTKLELFAVTSPAQSEGILEKMKEVQVEIFSGLGFPFRYPARLTLRAAVLMFLAQSD